MIYLPPGEGRKGFLIMPKFRHLTLDDRIIVQAEIEKGTSTLTKLAKRLGVPRSTVYREIKGNACIKKGKWRMFPHSDAGMPPCPLLLRFPFVCNPCPRYLSSRCTKDAALYDACEADLFAKEDLHESRRNPKLGAKAMKELDDRVSPLIMEGQSLYNIVASDPSLGVSQSTLRRYVKRQYLKAREIDLPRAVRFRASRQYDYGGKRVDVRILEGRTYLCFSAWREANPKAFYLEVDTVVGKATDSTCLLTVFEPRTRFQWGYACKHTADDVAERLGGFLSALAGRCPFKAILGDNGPEFPSLPSLEADADGAVAVRCFYCDPYRSGQKGGCESNHRLVRYAYRKGESLDSFSQEDADGPFSQIDSLRRKSLNGETPAEAFRRLFGDEALEATGVRVADPKKITLKKKAK
jgi:IS30 family transposase